MSKLRLIFRTIAEREAQTLRVTGARLALEAFGPGVPGPPESGPARLVFFVAFLKKARPGEPPEFEQFASLDGELEERDGRTFFNPSVDAQVVYDDPEMTKSNAFRAVELQFGDTTLPPEEKKKPKEVKAKGQPDVGDSQDANADDAEEESEGALKTGEVPARLVLKLPRESIEDRFIELTASLELDGNVAADKAVNDRLDIPIPPPSPNPADTLPAGCFGFDLSFPTPGIMPALRQFAERAKNEERAIGIFAHTDSVGSEAYNKGLSDRRGKATLAVMTDDLELFESVEAEESWEDDVYQAMLRGLGCNPGPIDGKSGPLTERAVLDFQRDYNANLFHIKERERTAEDLDVNGTLDDKTRAALRDAYVAHFSTGLTPDDFHGPKFSGCGEFVPISDDADHNRRVTLTIYEELPPAADDFPCVEGDPAACDLDDQRPRRCRFYRKVVLEDEELPPPTLADFEWLKLDGGTIHLSAVTSAPDDEEALFTVHKTDTEPSNPLPNSKLEPGPVLELGARVGEPMIGIAAFGVIDAKWPPPEGFDPFDVDQWVVNLGMFSEDDEDEPDEEPDATPEAAGSGDYFHPPLFCIEFEEAWGYAPPPGERLARFLMHANGGENASGLAVHSDGFGEPFETKGTRIEKDRDELVIRIALNPDSDIDEEQTENV